MTDFRTDPAFSGISPFSSRVWLSSPTMHGEEKLWMNKAIDDNWVSTVGENINEIEKMTAQMTCRVELEDLNRLVRYCGMVIESSAIME